MKSEIDNNTSTASAPDTSISSEMKQREEFLIREDLQVVENKLQYDRSLDEAEKYRLRAFADRRENDLAELMNQ